MTHEEITEAIGNKKIVRLEALVFGYGKNKTDWYKITGMVNPQSEYTLKVDIGNKEQWLPNRVIKQIREAK